MTYRIVKLFILSICLLVIPSALATVPNDAGNGGYGIVCKNPNGSLRVMLLDFYEAKFRKIFYSLGINNTVEEKVRVALDRLGRLDDKRAKRYQERADSFMKNASFFPNITLRGKIDFVTGIIENGCDVGLVALQKKPRFEEDKLYTISEDLWKGMNNDHRAGLILHEIVYQDALDSGQPDSVGTRYFVGTIASKKLEAMDEKSYSDLVHRTGLDDSPEVPSRIPVLLWLIDPITYTVVAESSLNANARQFFSSQGEPATFFVRNAPHFVRLSSDGNLVASPSEEDVGSYSFSIIAKVAEQETPVQCNLKVTRH